MIGPGGYATGRDPDTPHASRAAPTAECIYWRPMDGEASGPGAAEYPVYIRQRALAALHDHFRGSAQQGILGFLVGALLEDPTTHHRWIEIEFIVRLTQAIYGDKTTLVISRVWERLQQEVGRTGGHMLGWYHSHPPLGIEIAPGDIEAHEQYFGRPWQVALVLGHGPKGPTGAVYRPSAGLPLGTTPLPFYEIVARDSVTPEGRRRTRVAWRNYKPDMKRTSGAITGISAVLQALQVPKRAEVAPAAPPARRKRITPPRGSAAIRLPEPAAEPAPSASAPAPGIRNDAALSVPSTLLRSAVAPAAPAPPAATTPPQRQDDAPPQAPPQPAAPAVPAAAASAPPPPPAAPLAPTPVARTSAPEPVVQRPPTRPAEKPRPAAAAGAPSARPAPPPAEPPVEALVEPPAPEPAPAVRSEAGPVRPRARPTEEVLKDLATMLSGPRGRSSLSRASAPTVGEERSSGALRAPSDAAPVVNPGRVTFTPAPDAARASGPVAAAEPPEELVEVPPPEPVEEVQEAPVDEVPEDPPVSYTPSPVRRPAPRRPTPVDLAAVTQPLETPPETPVPLRVSSELAVPRRWSGEITPLPTPRRSVGLGLDAVPDARRSQVRLPFVAALFLVLAGAAWWLFLRPQTGAAPADAASANPPAAGFTEPVLDTSPLLAADPVVDAVVPVAGVGPAVGATGSDPLVAFDGVFDSLTAAIINYQATALRFDEGDRNCGTLSAALIAVDRLWVRYNRVRRQVGAPLDSLRQSLDQGVYGNVDSVDGHFRQSGCPRP